MLGFGGTAVTRRTTLQSSDQTVVQITQAQVPSHRALYEIIDLNDPALHRCRSRSALSDGSHIVH